jgi:hypothetical protein
MNTRNSTLTRLVTAVRLGWTRQRNSDFNRANSRLQGLLMIFCGYCVAAVFIMSLIGVAIGRDIKGNLEGAAITAVAAFVLIKLGKAIRWSGTSNT